MEVLIDGVSYVPAPIVEAPVADVAPVVDETLTETSPAA